MRRSGQVVGAALAFGAALVAVAPLLQRIGRSWPERVAVAGHSMEPTLHSGDWLLVDPAGFVNRAPRVGDLVVVRDPRLAGQLLIKRVTSVEPDGRLSVAGDHPAHTADDVLIGQVDQSSIVGRPWLRYWPLRRLGRVG
jgi:nickel-type superoxide dismutase maturation protease